MKYEDTSGKFHSGDSYIVLKTIQTNSGKLEWHIHFWLGAESTKDEIGTAALKTIELDDSFGGAAIQHREVTHIPSSEPAANPFQLASCGHL